MFFTGLLINFPNNEVRKEAREGFAVLIDTRFVRKEAREGFAVLIDTRFTAVIPSRALRE